MLKGIQGARAFKLADKLGHLWPSAITAKAAETLSERPELEGDSYTDEFLEALRQWNADFDAAVTAIIEEGISIDEIRRRAEAEQWENTPLGIMAPTFDPDFSSIVHTTGTGRLSWEIATDGTVIFTVSRPCRDTLPPSLGDVLRGFVDPDGTWDCEYLPGAEDGKNVRWRHVCALENAIQVLVPDADVKALFSDIPCTPEAEFAADVVEALTYNPAVSKRLSYFFDAPVRLTLETHGWCEWKVIEAKSVVVTEQA